MPYQRVTATISRPAVATAYTAGDIIANSGTAGEVVPLTFKIPAKTGTVMGCSCVVTPASSNLVITALDFNLLLFRPVAGIPFAAGGYPADNAAMAITAASFRELVARFNFVNTAWTNPAGALTAGATGYQAVIATTSRVSPVFDTRGDYGTTQPDELIGVIQVLGSWTPTGIINRFDFALDLETP